MERHELDKLRERVPCAAVLKQAGFLVDAKESTRRAVKHRRGDDIIIVIHDGKGWFDPLSEAKGDVFKLVEYIDHAGFREALTRVAELVGFEPATPVWIQSAREREPDITMPERWRRRRVPWRGSVTWRYLRDERCIAESVIRAAVRQGKLREGPHGSMWAAHTNDAGIVTGWEERGPEWRGFATGGAKVLFRFGLPDALRLYVTEAAIDAMSLAAIDEMRADSLYLSTGGGWASATLAAIEGLTRRPGAQIVAATDNNRQGEVFADRVSAIAAKAQCPFLRLRPGESDWNEVLRKMKEGRDRERKRAAAA